MKVEIGPYPKGYDPESRKIEVKIDPYDVWNLDNTLAHIIYPALVVLKEHKHGTPSTDAEDAPGIVFEEAESEPWNSARWEYILDEMIWTFKSIAEEDEPFGDMEENAAYWARIRNGTRLLGKYYFSLWD